MHIGSPNSKNKCAKRNRGSSPKKSKDSKKHHDPKSISDYLAVAWTISTLPAAMFVESVANFFAGSKRRPFMDTISLSVMGHCYRESTLRQLRILTSTGTLENELRSIVYSVSFACHGLPNYNKDFPGDGFSARWISEIEDRTKDDPVILYLHGGGYALKTCQPQVSYICALARQLLPYRVSILALDYSISPFFKYPTQREEGVACLQELLKVCNKPILLGDSCGGHLALSILLEEDRIKPQSVFGVALISPWVDPTAQEGSMNSKRDILSKRRLLEMAHSWLHADDCNDPKTNPMRQDPNIWKRILPENTCSVWGSDECLADQNVEFQKVADIKNYFVERNGTHDCILRGLDPPPCRYVSNCIVNWVTGGANNLLDGDSNSPSRLLRSGSLFRGKFRKSNSNLSTPLSSKDVSTNSNRELIIDDGSPRKQRNMTVAPVN